MKNVIKGMEKGDVYQIVYHLEGKWIVWEGSEQQRKEGWLRHSKGMPLHLYIFLPNGETQQKDKIEESIKHHGKNEHYGMVIILKLEKLELN